MGWLDNWNKDESIALPSPRELPNHLDLRDAAIVCASATPRLMTYAVVLQDEICKRTKRHWTIVPHGDVGPLPEPCVVLNVDPNSAIPTPEGYTLVVVDATVRVTGGSDRGLLFGVGRLLREMTLDYHESYTAALASVCGITLGLHIVSAPMYALRQHQVYFQARLQQLITKAHNWSGTCKATNGDWRFTDVGVRVTDSCWRVTEHKGFRRVAWGFVSRGFSARYVGGTGTISRERA